MQSFSSPMDNVLAFWTVIVNGAVAVIVILVKEGLVLHPISYTAQLYRGQCVNAVLRFDDE